MPAVVSNLEAFDVRATELSLRWTPGDADSGRYWIAYAKGATAPDCAPTVDVKATTATISGLDANTAYAFRLCPVDDRGGALTIDPGITANASTLLLPPSEPSNLEVVQQSPGTFAVTWSAAQGAASYAIAIAEGSAAPASCATPVTTTTNTFVTLSATTNQRHAIRVCARNANPTPDVSPGVTKLAFMHSALAPNPAVTLPAHGAHWLRATWDAVGSDYRVAIGTTPPAAGCATGEPTQRRSRTVISLGPETQYFVRVCATNGDSEPAFNDGTLVSITLPELIRPHVNGLYCANFDSPSVRFKLSGSNDARYRYTAVEQTAGSSPLDCTTTSPTLAVTSQFESFAQIFGLQSGGHSYHVRVCYLRSNGTIDQGQATILTTARVEAGIFFPGSCGAQPVIEQPSLTMFVNGLSTTHVNLSGFCSAGDAIIAGGDATGTTTCDANGQWSMAAVVDAPGDEPVNFSVMALREGRFQSIPDQRSITP